MLIMDFKMALANIPPWMSICSTVPVGYTHNIHATMKVQASESSHNAFTGDLHSVLTTLQCHSLEWDLFFCLYHFLLMPIIFL